MQRPMYMSSAVLQRLMAASAHTQSAPNLAQGAVRLGVGRVLLRCGVGGSRGTPAGGVSVTVCKTTKPRPPNLGPPVPPHLHIHNGLVDLVLQLPELLQVEQPQHLAGRVCVAVCRGGASAGEERGDTSRAANQQAPQTGSLTNELLRTQFA